MTTTPEDQLAAEIARLSEELLAAAGAGNTDRFNQLAQELGANPFSAACALGYLAQRYVATVRTVRTTLGRRR